MTDRHGVPLRSTSRGRTIVTTNRPPGLAINFSYQSNCSDPLLKSWHDCHVVPRSLIWFNSRAMNRTWKSGTSKCQTHCLSGKGQQRYAMMVQDPIKLWTRLLDDSH